MNLWFKKKHICFENNPRRSPTIHIWCRIYYCHSFHKFQIGEPVAGGQVSSVTVSVTSWFLLHLILWWHPIEKTFFDLVTLTFELDLDNLPLDLHAKIQVCTSFRARQMDRRTERHIDDAKTITPVADAGCKKGAKIDICVKYMQVTSRTCDPLFTWTSLDTCYNKVSRLSRVWSICSYWV